MCEVGLDPHTTYVSGMRLLPFQTYIGFSSRINIATRVEGTPKNHQLPNILGKVGVLLDVTSFQCD
jgi:hypothetical protein